MRHLLYFWLLFHFRLHWHCAVVSSVIVVDACYQYSVEVLIFNEIVFVECFVWKVCGELNVCWNAWTAGNDNARNARANAPRIVTVFHTVKVWQGLVYFLVIIEAFVTLLVTPRHACPLVDLCTVWHWRRRQCAMSNIIWIFFTTTQDGLCRKYRGGALDSLISRQYIQKTWSTKPIRPWRLHTVAVFSRNRLVINKMIKTFLLVHHAKTWMPLGSRKINSRTFIVGLLWTFDDKTLSRQIYLKVKLIVAAFYLICKSSELKGKDQKEKI